ncbi:MAG: hypothetical protein ACD_79C01155G0001 [uncultured bacterium]|nr:MAG: hypothetical protein ACD_79C01155G0001 [uncultured bacterium]
MKIKDVLAEAKKLEDKPDINLLKTQSAPTLIHVLIAIEETIKHLTKLYADSRISDNKKKEFERIIREAETRSMAILTILRNRK